MKLMKRVFFGKDIEFPASFIRAWMMAGFQSLSTITLRADAGRSPYFRSTIWINFRHASVSALEG
jgi:hypothetical protein